MSFGGHGHVHLVKHINKEMHLNSKRQHACLMRSCVHMFMSRILGFSFLPWVSQSLLSLLKASILLQSLMHV
jgi:hypothetical protein